MIFGKKIEKNNNVGNEFSGINTHHNMIFIKIFFCKLQSLRHFSKPLKKGLTTRTQKTWLKFIILSK